MAPILRTSRYPLSSEKISNGVSLSSETIRTIISPADNRVELGCPLLLLRTPFASGSRSILNVNLSNDNSDLKIRAEEITPPPERESL